MNRVAPFYYGTRLTENLEFSMEIINKHGQQYESWEVQIIQNWLFGRSKPELLTIFDPDKMNESYECWLINPQVIKVANMVVGWKCTARCTSPYSITNIKTDIIECIHENTQYNYWNKSDVEDYLYIPEMTIQLAEGNTYIRIENENDNNRVFQLAGLRTGETIYINNDLCTMDTESGDRILNNFNLNFFRVCEGLNKLNIQGKGIIMLRTRFNKAVGGY